MGYVGWGTVVDQANTETGGGADVVADVTADLPIGRGVAGSGVINTYSFFPSLNFSFTTLNALPSQITFSRGTNATLFNSSGTLVWAPNNAIRNNTMVGAVAGTPGTSPTNWTITTGGGVTRTIVGVGTENGITYVDVRLQAASAVNAFILFDTNNQIAASNGQTWTASTYVKLISGATTNLDISSRVTMYSSAPALLGNFAVTFVPTTANLANQRYLNTATLNNASVATINSELWLLASGAYDITLRIGMPQLERGSVATAVNATSGTAYFGPRFDYDPSTLAARGLLIEEQRTNSIRNNTMQGAVAGTPGTDPTNWFNTIPAGITQQLVGVGIENGITYIDYRFSGTATGSIVIRPDGETQVVASSGQAWTGSTYVRLIAGSLTNVSCDLNMRQGLAAGGLVLNTSFGFTPTSAALNTQRVVNAVASMQPTTERIINRIILNIAGAIDITLRIGLPQLEQGAFATSVIPTTTTALTRNADVASVNTLTPWFNQTEGSLYVEWQSNPTAYARYLVSIEQAGTSATRIDININSVNAVNPRTVVSGAAVASLTGGTYTAGTIAKVAFGYKSADYASSFNGAAAVTATTAGALPSSLATVYLGSITGGIPLNGWLRRVSYYPRRLVNAELQALTA